MTVTSIKSAFEHKLALLPKYEHNLKLDSGSSAAVIGSGPAESFFSFCLLELAERAGLNISVDIYDNKDFSKVTDIRNEGTTLIQHGKHTKPITY